MTDKPKRFTDALYIQLGGACNPAGIALTLHNACKEVIAEGGNQRTDPAVRLIAHQLAFLLGVDELNDSLTVYDQFMERCRAETPDEAKAKLGEAGR